MSEYYKANRTKNLYNPKSTEPFKLSRSRIEDFSSCPKCFYLDRRLGIGEPGGFPFNLNTAVDTLLKKEFDVHRAKQVAHPLMKAYGLKAVPFEHEMINEWRENFKGVQYHHKPTNFIVTGAVDDLWKDDNEEIIVEVFPNRPDLLSEAGLARALSSFINSCPKTFFNWAFVLKWRVFIIISPSTPYLITPQIMVELHYPMKALQLF